MQKLEDDGQLDPASIERRRMLRKLHKPTSAEIGRKGGSVSSQAKREAVRRNGAKGGRPHRDSEPAVAGSSPNTI
jgi:hypothetical protein